MFIGPNQIHTTTDGKRRLVGRFTDAHRDYLAAQESFLGNLFKGDKDKIAEAKSTSEKKLKVDIDTRNTELNEAYAAADKEVTDYVNGVKELAAAIRGKKFDAAEFSKLKTPSRAFTYRVLDGGLFHIDDVHGFLEECFDYFLGKKSGIPSLDWLHGRNAAFIPLDEHVLTALHFLGDHDEATYYYAPAGTEFGKLGYPNDFIPKMISGVNVTTGAIKTVMNMRSTLTAVQQHIEGVINSDSGTARDYEKRVKAVLHNYLHAATMLETAVSTVTSIYLGTAVRTAQFIVKHCYK